MENELALSGAQLGVAGLAEGVMYKPTEALDPLVRLLMTLPWQMPNRVMAKFPLVRLSVVQKSAL
jgi:hypothetical protein